MIRSPKKIAIIGIGLMGGSLGQALRRRGGIRVLGIARHSKTLTQAKRLGAIDEGSIHLWDAVQADIVVVATPVQTVVPLLAQLVPILKPGTLVTDVGSVKGEILAGVRKLRWPKSVFFCGSHPLAGSHRTGVGAARVDLFVGSTCVVVPFHPEATRAVERLWRMVGARTKQMTAATHDTAVAVTSHLPHLLAHALVRYVARRPDREVLRALVASSFRDMTRVAASDPALWYHIFRANRAPLLRALTGFKISLRELAEKIPQTGLERELRVAQNFRARLFK